MSTETPNQTPTEALLNYQGKLDRLKVLRDYVEKELNLLGVGGQGFNEWACSCENKALNAVTKAIKGDLNLPVDENKLLRIPEENKIQYGHGYGRWLEKMKPEFLQAWIDKNIGPNPVKTEIQNTLDFIFPTYLREPEKVFDDKKNTVNRHVGYIEKRYTGDLYTLSYSFEPKPYEKFLQLCNAIGGNIPYGEAIVEPPLLFKKGINWESEDIFTWHMVPNSEGVLRVRPLKEGTWRFELTGPAYVKIKELGQKNLAKKSPNY